MLVGVATALAAASLTAKGDHIQYLMPCMGYHVCSGCVAHRITMFAHLPYALRQVDVRKPQLLFNLMVDALLLVPKALPGRHALNSI